MHQIRTTVSVDEDLLRRAKAAAGESHRTLSAVINDALLLHLRPTSDAETEDTFSLPVFGRGGLMPGVDLEDKGALSSLLGDEEFPRAHA